MKINNERGQGLIEYLIIVAIMAVGTMAVMRVLGHSVDAQFAKITQQLTGDASHPVEVEQIQTKDYKKRDMKDFIDGAIQ